MILLALSSLVHMHACVKPDHITSINIHNLLQQGIQCGEGGGYNSPTLQNYQCKTSNSCTELSIRSGCQWNTTAKTNKQTQAKTITAETHHLPDVGIGEGTSSSAAVSGAGVSAESIS